MDDDDDNTMFLIAGTVVSESCFVATAGYNAAPDAASSRIYLRFGEDWVAHNVSEDFLDAVTFDRGVLYAVGKNGLVKTVGQPGEAFTLEAIRGRFQAFEIEPAQRIGPLSKVRATPAGTVVCGWGAQVYRLQGTQYSALHDGLDAGIDWLDIDGDASGRLYAVGLAGRMGCWSGGRWALEGLPTNVNLHAVRCLPNGEVLAAGREGTLLRGQHGHWSVIDTGLDGNFWAIEAFAERAYLSYANSQLFCLEGDTLSEVKLDQLGDVFTNRLAAGHGSLWSIGSNALLRFDGAQWTRVACPDMG
ncbi:hypothetical protein [Piscinibacterium candidicorallinum]|uniref:Uncharacterized protein n=1 Tax=Piscinibacterium candidicorallinum TaxID=1793872 RepID=A0ABV7H944_9BURK